MERDMSDNMNVTDSSPSLTEGMDALAELNDLFSEDDKKRGRRVCGNCDSRTREMILDLSSDHFRVKDVLVSEDARVEARGPVH